MPVKSHFQTDSQYQGIKQQVLMCDPSSGAKRRALALLSGGLLGMVVLSGALGKFYGAPLVTQLLGAKSWIPLATSVGVATIGGAAAYPALRALSRKLEASDVKPKVSSATAAVIKRAQLYGGLNSRKGVEERMRADIERCVAEGLPTAYSGPYPLSYASTHKAVGSVSDEVIANPAAAVVIDAAELDATYKAANSQEHMARALEYLSGFMADDEIALSDAGYRVRQELHKQGVEVIFRNTQDVVICIARVGSPVGRIFNLSEESA